MLNSPGQAERSSDSTELDCNDCGSIGDRREDAEVYLCKFEDSRSQCGMRQDIILEPICQRF